MKIAVITGASSGIGFEFAKLIDKEYDVDEIWVIARRKERLDYLGKLLKTKTRALALDLTDKRSILQYNTALKEAGAEISVLVNASGFGKFGKFTDIPAEEYRNMIDLNCTALVEMVCASLPYMKRGSHIYNIGSLSSFQPVPLINVYGATKAFVLSFSRALNTELKPRGIRVIAVCPGWVNTEFFKRAVFDFSIKYFNKVFEAKDVVCRALSDMKKGKDVSILGLSVRAQVLAVKLLPHRLVMKIWLKQQGHAKNAEEIYRDTPVRTPEEVKAAKDGEGIALDAGDL